MRDNAILAGEILRHGAYVCVQLPDGGAARAMASVAIPALAEKLGLDFECAEADVPTFHQVRASLRDVDGNPEWKFVREGPTWHGRRVAAWADLFSADAT